MVDGLSAHLQGLDPVLRRMRTLAPKLQRSGLKAAVRKGATVFARAARENAKQVDDPETGESIARNIATQFSSRESKREKGVVYRVGVLGGAKLKNDPGSAPGGFTWYWRFVALGTSKVRARDFMLPAMVNNLDRATSTVVSELERQIDKAVAQ